MREDPILPSGVELVGPEPRARCGEIIIAAVDRGPLILFFGLIGRGRRALEGESEKVDVLWKRRRSLIGWVQNQLDTRGAPNRVRVSLRERNKARLADRVAAR